MGQEHLKQNLRNYNYVSRPSHLRRAIFGPYKWPVYRGSVRAISGPSNRQTENRHRLTCPLHYRTWPVYGPSTVVDWEKSRWAGPPDWVIFWPPGPLAHYNKLPKC